MIRRLTCLIVDAGPASYMEPVLARWIEDPPRFDWRLLLGEPASAALRHLQGLTARIDGVVARDAETVGPLHDALLASSGGWPVERAAVCAAQEAGIPCTQFLDNCYNYALRFSYRGDTVIPDRMLFVTAESVAEALAENVPVEAGIVVGHPGWEVRSPQGPAKQCGTLFLGAPVERDYGTRLGYTEHDAWALLVDALNDVEGVHGTLYYAPHPEQDAQTIPQDAVTVRFESRLLEDVDTVAGMFSAPLVEAYLAGRRCLSIQPGASGRDMFFLSRQGYMPRIRSRNELVAALHAPPADPHRLAGQLAGSGARLNACLEEMLGP